MKENRVKAFKCDGKEHVKSEKVLFHTLTRKLYRQLVQTCVYDVFECVGEEKTHSTQRFVLDLEYNKYTRTTSCTSKLFMIYFIIISNNN